MLKILLDMDNTLFDFDRGVYDRGGNLDRYRPPEMSEPGFFANLKPFKGAIKFVEQLSKLDVDLYICSVPVADQWWTYGDKVKSINTWFPQLSKKIILTQDKSMVKADILIDDSIEKFEDGSQEWVGIKFNYKNDPAKEYAKVLETVKAHIELQEKFDRDRIVSETYAEGFLGEKL